MNLKEMVGIEAASYVTVAAARKAIEAATRKAVFNLNRHHGMNHRKAWL